MQMVDNETKMQLWHVLQLLMVLFKVFVLIINKSLSVVAFRKYSPRS